MVKAEQDPIIQLPPDRETMKVLKESERRASGILLGTRDDDGYDGSNDPRIRMKILAIRTLLKGGKLSLNEVLGWCRHQKEHADAKEAFLAVQHLVKHGKDSDPPKRRTRKY